RPGAVYWANRRGHAAQAARAESCAALSNVALSAAERDCAPRLDLHFCDGGGSHCLCGGRTVAGPGLLRPLVLEGRHMAFSQNMNRREFIAATAAAAGATRLPIAVVTEPPHGSAQKGRVVVFQGDSITDAGRAAAARVAKAAKATFVPLQKVFDQHVHAAPPAYWAADGVHPTPAGHAVIAEQWRHAAGL